MTSSSSPPPLLAVAEAQARLLALASPVEADTVPLPAAAGRRAAADVVAKRSQPAADLSAMDGYAIRFADRPRPLRLIGESAAGRPFAGRVGAAEAVRIFTGAVMPTGADCVLIQEEAARAGDTVTMTGDGPRGPGGNVRRAGLDFAAGDTLVTRGEVFTPARLALAAVGGHGAVAVARRVRIAIAATGDELVPPGGPLAPGQLPESNSLMLAAVLGGADVAVSDLGVLPDRLDALREAFANACADLLVTTGGASVGDHDLVRPAIEAAGGSVDFWRVELRPGKPIMAGRIGKTVVVALPGNPVSAFVTAILFVRPLIAAMAGAADPLPALRPATLGAALPANGARQDYLRGWHEPDGRVVAAPVQDSGMLRTLAAADCLIARAPHAPPAAAGDAVQVLPL